VLREKDRVRRTLGYLPQEFGVYPSASAERLLEHFAVLEGFTDKATRKRTVEALLRKTNLWDVRKQRLGGYSGGMRQRFGIAVALLGDPSLIIVDEPTAGLDPAERVRFLNLLSEIGENSVVILSTHIVEDVRQLCARMAILADGRVLCEGAPDALVSQLHGRVWSKTVAKQSVAWHRDTLHVLSAQLHAGKTRLRVLADAAPDAAFEPVSPDLEDVYFRALADRRAAA
jgi:ABC-type multidrug transport system ATPase subunit